MPNPNNPNTQMLNPEGLANQLFTIIMQNQPDPRLVAQQVIGFLGSALMHAITSSKNDPVAYLTETLISVIAATTSGDEAARKEQFTLISNIFASAANPAPAAGAPATAQP